MKVLPLFVLSLMVFGCGGSGDPDGLADSIKDDIISESFTSLYDYQSDWAKDSSDKESEAMAWRYEEGYEKWDNLKKYLEELDPKDKSEITGKDEWKEASHAQRYAVFTGAYKIYKAESYEDRLKEGIWYLNNRRVKLDVEGQGTAEYSYRNQYKDKIEITLRRENGSWYMTGVNIDMPKDKPKKPKDD